jgi:hypothetical protein
MKKLAVLLQIVGLLAVCPMYVFLEIRHSRNEKSEEGSDSLIKPKTEIMNTRISNTPINKSEEIPYMINK